MTTVLRNISKPRSTLEWSSSQSLVTIYHDTNNIIINDLEGKITLFLTVDFISVVTTL